MKIRTSIFTKLFIVVLICAVLIFLLIGAFFHSKFSHYRYTVFTKNVDAYADYLIRDMGFPPDERTGKLLSEKTQLNISVESSSVNWSTTSFAEWNENLIPTDKGFYSWHKGIFYYITDRNGYRYHFQIMRSDLSPETQSNLYFFLTIIAAVMAGAYLIIRRMLKPLAYLSRGVAETSAGNLEYRVPVTSKDELGNLSSSFNDMNRRISRMLKAREQLLSDVSHELRSPLTRIKVAMELMPDSPGKDSIRDDIAAIDFMISEILESQRLEHLADDIEFSKIDTAELLQEVLKEFSISGNRIKSVFPDTFPAVYGDRERLKIVFRNIISNALKYSDPDDGMVTVGGSSTDSEIRITVHDNGPGIPQEELDIVFEPFYRIDRSRSRNSGGYGLGLHICKKIMEAHNGSISIESSPDKGTDVILTFPLGN